MAGSAAPPAATCRNVRRENSMTVPKRCCASTRAHFVDNEAVTPADSTRRLSQRPGFGTLRWQLSNRYYTDCGKSWKGRDGKLWAVGTERSMRRVSVYLGGRSPIASAYVTCVLTGSAT